MDTAPPNATRSTDYPLAAIEIWFQNQPHNDAGPLRLQVVGYSMIPLLRPGDWIEVRHTALASPALGQVWLLRQGDRLLVHRLVDQSPDGWQSKGDWSAIADPALPAPCLLGRVERVQRDQYIFDLGSPTSQRLGRWIAQVSMTQVSMTKIPGFFLRLCIIVISAVQLVCSLTSISKLLLP